VVAFIRGQGPSDKHGNGGAKPIVLVIIPNESHGGNYPTEFPSRECVPALGESHASN